MGKNRWNAPDIAGEGGKAWLNARLRPAQQKDSGY